MLAVWNEATKPDGLFGYGCVAGLGSPSVLVWRMVCCVDRGEASAKIVGIGWFEGESGAAVLRPLCVFVVPRKKR